MENSEKKFINLKRGSNLHHPGIFTQQFSLPQSTAPRLPLLQKRVKYSIFKSLDMDGVNSCGQMSYYQKSYSTKSYGINSCGTNSTQNYGTISYGQNSCGTNSTQNYGTISYDQNSYGQKEYGTKFRGQNYYGKNSFSLFQYCSILHSV